MNCPVCSMATLQTVETDEQLKSLKCTTCSGQWIPASQYWAWIERHGPNQPERQPAEGDEAEALEVQETHKIKTCPECSHFLIRYRVGHGLNFSIDRCSACGGLWFDANEWDILKARNLHDDVPYIFSAAWQLRAAREEELKRRDARMLRQLGEEDFAEVERMKNWLAPHPRRSLILAYLAGK